MTDLSRNHFNGVSGSQQFIDDIPGVTWTSALTNAAISEVQYVSTSSSVLISAGTSGSSPARIVARGWEPSPHQTSGGAEAYVRWDSQSHGWAKISVLNSAAQAAMSFAMNSQGQGTYEIRTSANFLAANLPFLVDVTADVWYKIAFEWDPPTDITSAGTTDDGHFYLKWNDVEIYDVSGRDRLSNISNAEIANIGVTGRVWFDDWRLFPGVDISAISVDVDSAEFDWETQNVGVEYIVSASVALFEGFRCRVVNVPACPRSLRAKNACRTVWVDPEVLH